MRRVPREKGKTMPKKIKRMLPFSELQIESWIKKVKDEIRYAEEKADWEKAYERTYTWNLY